MTTAIAVISKSILPDVALCPTGDMANVGARWLTFDSRSMNGSLIISVMLGIDSKILHGSVTTRTLKVFGDWSDFDATIASLVTSLPCISRRLNYSRNRYVHPKCLENQIVQKTH